MTQITIPGVYPELSDAYHGPIRLTPTRALSYSGIKILLTETPLDFITPKDKKSEAMNFGSVVHALALDKGAQYVVSPYDDYKTKLAREWRDEQYDAGRIPIKPDDFDDASEMARVIKIRIRQALDGADYETEVPMYWQEGDTWCSAMVDVWCAEKMTCIDPKVTPVIHGERARSHMSAMCWPIQSAWTRRGLGAIYPEHEGRIKFKNLLIHPDEPHVTRVVSIGEGWRQGAERDCLRALAMFNRCVATNDWPAYPDEETWDEPAWMQNQRLVAEIMEEENE